MKRDTNFAFVRAACVIAATVFCVNVCAEEGEAKPRYAMGIWSRATPSGAPLPAAAQLEKDGWTQLAQAKEVAFEKDVLISNGKSGAVFRRNSPAVELYSLSADGTAVLRTKLTLAATDGTVAASLNRVQVVENSKGAVSVSASFKPAGAGEMWANYKLTKGGMVLEIEAGTGSKNNGVPSENLGTKLRVEAPSRFVVMPDFFADDIVIDARKVKPAAIEIPSENFLLQMVGDGEAIVMSVFESRDQDAKLTLSGEGDQRVINASEIDFGTPKKSAAGKTKGNKIWISVFEGPNIFHVADVSKSDAGKVIPLNWKMPLPAIWRADFTRPDELTDSWLMLLQEKEKGKFFKPSWLGSNEDTLDVDRKRWNTVLGTFKYPVWCDFKDDVFMQPLKNEHLSFVGPVLLYPIARLQQTPVDRYTVFDVIRNSLGVGPCEYILDLEGQKSEYKGRATCSTRDTLAGIYKKNQQAAQRDKVDKTLDDAMTFCTHIRGRITRYVDFGHAMRAYLKEQKAAHPEISASIDEMDKIAAEIDARFDARKEKIRTLEYVAQLNANFRKDVLNDDSPEALAKCKKYGKDLVEVGDNQDELSSECRWVVKTLRQRAGMLPASDPKSAALAAEIRKRTQDVLRNPAAHEGSQH